MIRMAIADAPATHLLGEAPPSPAGPIGPGELAALNDVPVITLPRAIQILRFNQRQIEFVFGWRRRLGETFRMHGMLPGRPVFVSHPDHVRSLFTAKPHEAPSLVKESPLRPIVGPNSTLTAVGDRHMRQRKMLLPPFHGDAIARYVELIEVATAHEIDRWPVDKPFALAPRMSAITLDVIMSGIFGIEGTPPKGTPEWGLRTAIRSLISASTMPVAQVGELMNVGRDEPVGIQKIGLALLDKPTYAVIAKRRKAADLDERQDVMSLLMRAETEEGEHLTDRELRDELLTLVLAGHETTANSLAWTWERLVRTPSAYDRLIAAVRDEEDAADNIEAAIIEGMRSRPVIPTIGRRVSVPWQLGEYGVEAGTPIVMSILLVHHREDVYPDPFAFKPERWLGGRKPGTYDWIPFGGGIRRCLGAALAMAEQRVVMEAMASRLDLEADRPEPEHAVHRNVTMIPSRGGRVVMTRRD